VGPLRPTSRPLLNRALKATVTASSTRPELKIEPNQDPKLDRTEFFVPQFAADASNGSRWMAADGDTNPWLQVDLGAPTDILGTDACFVQPTHGHAFKIESSLDGETWQPYAEVTDVRIQSPHQDKKTVRARFLRLTILQGTPGIWEFRVY
jgi:hypothetical protein